MLDLRRSVTGYVSLIGHRGADDYRPENTMVSFEHAVMLGANIMELDIQMSRDGEIVVMHDFTVDRTTNGSGRVKDMTLAELKKLDAGSWFGLKYVGTRIPTINEVLEWGRGKVWLAIEIKSAWITYPGIEQGLAKLLNKHSMVDDVMVISFDHCTLKRIKEIEPEVATGMLYSCRLADPISAARQTCADVLRPRWNYATAPECQAVHAEGLAYSPFTTGEQAAHDSRESLIDMGVDVLSADKPDVLRALLTKKGVAPPWPGRD